jgi:release factor glutamine methyltransferase
MLGLNDKGWLIDMLDGSAGATPASIERFASSGSTYNAYFGLGHSIRLEDRPGVFKVSLAGMALGAYLLKGLEEGEVNSSILDLGTGSGVLAFLLRSMGADDIVATDVSAEAVALARCNERLNFNGDCIRYAVSDLFDGLPAGETYDTVIFNPPGWRTPSDELLRELDRLSGNTGVPPGVMFCGDKLLVRFLNELPRHLRSGGRAIVGMNSLVGIRDVIKQHELAYSGCSPLRFRLVERHTFPLLFYSDTWKKAERILLEEFTDWQESNKAAFTLDGQGRLYWSYEIVECRLVSNGASSPASSADR